MTNPDKLIDFALEVFHGCTHNCYGCNVNKFEQQGFHSGDIERLTDLFDDAINKGYVLANLAIGPTDFMSATNGLEMIVQSVPLMDRFSAIVLQSTFLCDEQEIERWADLLRPHLAGRTIKFAFPLDPRHWKKTKYINRIMDRIRYFVSLLPDTKYTKTYVLVNMKEYADVGEDPLSTLELKIPDINGGYLHVDLIITDGRPDLMDLNNREKLKHSFKYMQRLCEELADAEGVSNTLGNYLKEAREAYSVDKAGRQFEDTDYIYKNGRIYTTVFAGENVTVFDEKLALSQGDPWTVDSLVKLDNQLLIDQLQYAGRTNECMDCEFVTSCIRKKLIQVMNIVKTKDCIAPKAAFESSRGAVIA